ncbi:elongation factor 1-beta [Candidatus Pacearchaeota archaeon ex4484_71]|nr:MAG: elongation factor 1-beta [Candidatus Pacearchaeota archaeon ex4484_71]
MAGIAGVTYKIMPVSPETDLEEIKKEISKLLEPRGANSIAFREEPIAFGLKAVIVVFQWPEEKELEEIEKILGEVENVQSVQMIDIRKIA